MPIKYSVHKKIKLLYTIFYGEVDFQDCKDYAYRIFNDPEVKLTTRTLAYLKNSTLKFNIEEVDEFARIITSNPRFTLREKLAVLIDKPIDTVAATIYTQALNSSSRKISAELYYTLDAALLFLGLADDKETILQLIGDEYESYNIS